MEVRAGWKRTAVSGDTTAVGAEARAPQDGASGARVTDLDRELVGVVERRPCRLRREEAEVRLRIADLGAHLDRAA